MPNPAPIKRERPEPAWHNFRPARTNRTICDVCGRTPGVQTHQRPAGSGPILPPGFRPTKGGLLQYRYTEFGVRHVVYGRSVDECLTKRYQAPPPAAPADSPTLAAWLRTWVAGLDLRESTVANHRQIVEGRLIPLFGERVTLAELDREGIKAKFAELRTWRVRGGGIIAPQSVALTYSTLRGALYAAVDSTPPRLAANPAARIKPNGTTGRKAQGARVGVELPIPSELEVHRLIRATRTDPWGGLIALAAFTGLRQGEALALTSDAVDAGWVHVRGSVSRATRAVDATKNATSDRHVPYHPALGPVLVAQAQERDRLALLGGPEYAQRNPEGRLWSKPDGSPLVGSTVSHWFAAACERAGIPHYRFHDLRHYYASSLINKGAPIGVVAKYLGHADVTITSRVYHHVMRHDELGLGVLAGDALAGALG
jgi:integrase